MWKSSMLDDSRPAMRGAHARARLGRCYTGAPSRRGLSQQRTSIGISQGIFMARIEVKSEITGTVWQVKANPGDKLEAGDVLVVIESMKMEIPVITEDPGVVKEILVKEKDPVAEGQVVAVLEE